VISSRGDDERAEVGEDGDHGPVTSTDLWSGCAAALRHGKLMAQNEDLDLVGGVGAGVEHYPARQLREHLVDQLYRDRRIMPHQPEPRSTSAAATREISGAHRTSRVSQFLALVADPWVVGHAGDAGLVDLGV
jgi:hypothetical protein